MNSKNYLKNLNQKQAISFVFVFVLFFISLALSANEKKSLQSDCNQIKEQFIAQLKSKDAIVSGHSKLEKKGDKETLQNQILVTRTQDELEEDTITLLNRLQNCSTHLVQ